MRQPYDYALAVKGYEAEAEAEAFAIEMDEVNGLFPNKEQDNLPKPPKTIRNQTREQSLESSRKGGKAKHRKLRMEKSLAAAEERRELRKAAVGVTLHYDYRAWSKLGTAKQEAFIAGKQSLGVSTYPETGLRWDFNRDFGSDYSGKLDGSEHLDHLFRSASANPAPLTWRSWETPRQYNPRSRRSGHVILEA